MPSFDIIAQLRLNGEQFSREFNARMDRVEAEARSTSARVSNAFAALGKIGGGLIAAGAIEQIAQTAKAALDYADNLATVADQVNINVERYQTLRQAYRALEVDGDAFDAGLKRIQVAMGQVQDGADNGATLALAKLGVAGRIASGEIRTTDAALDAVNAALRSYGTEAEAAAVMSALVGRKLGTEYAAAARDAAMATGELEESVRQSGSVISEEFVDRLADANESIDRFQERASQQFTIMAGHAITSFDKVATKAYEVARWLKENWDIGPVSVAQYDNAIGEIEQGQSTKGGVRAQRQKVLELQRRRNEMIQGQRRGGIVEEVFKGNSLPAIGKLEKEIREEAAKLQRMAGYLEKATAASRSRGRPQEDDVDPPTRTPARGGGSGKSSPKADPREDAGERILANLREQAEAAERGLDLERQRAVLSEDEAEVAEAVAQVRDRNAEILGKSVDDLRAAYGWTEAQAKAALGYLATLEKQAAEEVKLRQERERAAEAERKAYADFEREIRKAQDEAERAEEQSRREFEARQREMFRDLADFYEDALSGGSGDIWDNFKDMGKRAIAELAAQFTLALISGQKIDLGQIAGGVLGSAGGGAGGLGGVGAIGGALGSIGGMLRGSTWGGGSSGFPVGGTGILGSMGGVGSALSSAAPYITAGLAAFSLIGGLFKKPKFGTAVISEGADGQLTSALSSGRGSSQKNAATASASGVIDGVNNIMDALGASISGMPTISIGTYKDKYRVSTTGYGGRLDFKGASAEGLHDFGKDGKDEAITFAIKTMLEESVITGISQASVNVLKNTKDLDLAIEKATMIESIPKQLKARMDPVGAAIDDLNDRYKKLVDVLREGGATAEQVAEAQQLYRLELEEVKANTGTAAQSLREFLSNMDVGSASTKSLRDQEASAMAALKPYLDAINSGSAIDIEKYLAAADDYLGVQREQYGSREDYFRAEEMIRAATNAAIATVDKAVPIRESAADPFAQATATAAQATASATQVTNEILSQQLGQTNALLKQIAGAGQGAPSQTAMAKYLAIFGKTA